MAQRSTFRTRAAAIIRPLRAAFAGGEKANPAFAGVTIFNDVPQPHTMPRNYKNYADQGYATNDSVFKCVKYIMANGAAIPPKLYTDATRETEIASHPLLDLLARPNPEQDGVTFREAILGWYLITGNAFIYAIRPGKSTGAPGELWSLESTKVRPLPTPQGIVGYHFDDFDDSQNPIAKANIGHLRTWNPKDAIFGLSPIEVAALMIDQQNAARKWNLALMQNMGKTSGAWVTDAILDKTTRDALEAKINEKLTGARNAGKVPVIDAGAKWVQTSAAPAELDWLKSLQYHAGQIANLYDIPPQLIGDTSATTYNNMEQAKAASYTEAIFPALDKLYSLLSMWLVPMYPDLCDGKGLPKAVLYYDKDTVEVMQAVIQAQKDAQALRAQKLYMAGVITLNQAQELMGQPDIGPKGDVYRIGLVLVPADKLDVYAEQSLTEPAKAPMPLPEPLPAGAPPPAGTPDADLPPKPGSPDAPPPGSPAAAEANQEAEGEGEKAWLVELAQQKKRTLRQRKARANPDDVTHLVWECQPTACDFCLENNGVVVEAGDAFPNGCTTPDECHRFCECSAYEVNVPDDVSAATVAGMSAAALVALYAVGFIPSHHDADVAAQAEQNAADEEDESEDEEGDETAEDHTGATYAAPAKPKKPTKPKPKPKPKQPTPAEVGAAAALGAHEAREREAVGQAQDRKKRRTAYQQFVKATVDS